MKILLVETNDVTDGQASGPMASLVQKTSNASEIKDALGSRRIC